MRVLAIDPGTTESAYVTWDNELKQQWSGFVNNDALLDELRRVRCSVAAIEMVASYGMAVGREVFETCVWIGRFQQVLLDSYCNVELIKRQPVKLHHCQSPKAKDGNVRQALIDKYGPPGTKKAPGLTYGLKSHTWQAFAIATYVTESGLWT